MKEKKSKGLRKVFLMAVATALVIAISVSATLAFLTDSTQQRDNVFTGANAKLSGEIIEPRFEENDTYYFSPGKETPKDPMVHNTTTGTDAMAMYTGVKIEFLIQTDEAVTPFVPVDYAVFKKYVALKGLNIDFTGSSNTTNAAEGTSTSNKWGYIGEKDKALYLYYKKSIGADDGAEPSSSNSYAPGTDTTEAIFTSVDMSEFIHIPKTTPTVAGGNDAATVVGSNYTAIQGAANNLNVDRQYDQQFKVCNIQIKITGFGVEAASAGTDLSTAADSTEYTRIKQGLGFSA